jgi:esterase/lipase superfamily enzyme
VQKIGRQTKPIISGAIAMVFSGLLSAIPGSSAFALDQKAPVTDESDAKARQVATKTPSAGRVIPGDMNDSALKAVKIPVYYVTDRAPSDKGVLSYTSKRSDHLEYGQTDVTIPIDKDERGQAEAASTNLGWEAEPNGKDKATVGDPTRMSSSQQFFAALDKARRSTASGRVLVYVHGYAVDFDKSLRVAGRLAYHLQLPVVVFSWPSKHNAFKYTADECTAEWSTSDFETLLREMGSHFGNQNMVLVSHSMGSRIITWAIKSIADKAGTAKPELYQHIFFCSPDSDTGTFGRYVPYIEKAAADAKVFVSTKDIRLGVSRFLHGNGRLGRPGSVKKDGVIVSTIVQTIDFSAIDPGIGHSIPYPLLTEIVNNSSLPAGIELKSSGERPGEQRLEVIKEAKLHKQPYP